LSLPKAIINITNLRHNIKYIRSSINSKAEIIPVIKANAYGHGYKKIAEILKEEEIKCVSVATSEEIREILNLNLNLDVLHLGKIHVLSIQQNIYNNNNVISTIHSLKDIEIFKENKNLNFRCHLKVDTGLNRMGCRVGEIDNIIKEIEKNKNINLEGIYSHLACSEDKSSKDNASQINIFKKIIQKYNYKGYSFHLLNSGGIFNYPDLHLDYIRTGLSIYGISPYGKVNNYLKPVMKLVAPIVLIKNINKGEKIGYGCTYKSTKSMKIGIVQCGYADGIPLNFSNNGLVFYKKNELSLLGRVSMDLICIDLTDVNAVDVDDEVVIWGDNSFNASYLENISKKFNSIPYIYLTSLSSRVRRVYVEG